MVIGGGIASLLAAGVIGVFAFPEGDAPPSSAPSSQRQAAAAKPAGDATARSAILAALPNIGCSWLDLQALSGGSALERDLV
ncbi:MAG: hypothetical protein B7Z36_06165 [Novosphingobium sp. 12-63-9]|nr:MAG: hypothetical protein B7Z36_06165 [Novosphingobium sp. 12-63-9]